MLSRAALRNVLVVALVLGACAPAAARTVRAQVAKVDSAIATASEISMVLHWPDGAASGQLELTAAGVDAGDFGYNFRNVRWQCDLQRSDAAGWRCDGPLRAGKSREHTLAITLDGGDLTATFGSGRSTLGITRAAPTPELTTILMQRVPAAWLQAFAQTLWSDARLTDGRFSGELALHTPDKAPLQVRGTLDVTGLSLDTPDGAIAAASLDAGLSLDYQSDSVRTTIDSSVTTHGGELLVSPLYVQLPRSAVRIAVRGERVGTGDWHFPKLDWRDGTALTVAGSARLAPDFTVHALDLRIDSGDLAHARERYLSGVLGPAGLGELQLSGTLGVHLRRDASGWQEVATTLRGVNAIDPRGRFSFAGLSGDPHWTAATGAVTSGLGWDNGALFRLGLGPARFALRSGAREIAIAAPATLAILGGTLRLDTFAFTPADAEKTARAQLGLTLAGLDLASLSQRLGWPAFTGTVSGRIPVARYADNTLTFDGGLSMQLFGGSVAVRSMAMERPFGVAPTLSGDVRIDDLDLAALTGVLGVGSISGRLDGSIANLRLVDWAPVAFAADLHSDDTYKGRRRISQRAVQDLSNVGGSGIVGGLQNVVLQVFDDFGYKRIGLSCTLARNICTMGGVADDTERSAGRGYTIVEGSGLPRITVVGFQRRVDWPVLVERLQAVGAGQAPIVQ